MISNTISKKHTNRNSNLEILRIISIFLIISLHVKNYFLLASTEKPIIEYLTGALFGSWGILGVDIFVVISAYFLVDLSPKINRIINIILQVLTYELFFYLIYFINLQKTNHSFSFSVNTILKSFLFDLAQPFWSKAYWFVTAYFFMLVLSTMLNKLIVSVSKRSYLRILVFTVFIPIYAQFNINTICDIIYFCYIYLLIGYIKKHLAPSPKIRYIIYSLFLVFFVFLTKLFIYIKTDSNIIKSVQWVLESVFASTGRHSMILLLSAILIVLGTLSFTPRHIKPINELSTHSLGIYLFHENQIGDNILISIGDFYTTTQIWKSSIPYPLKYLLLCLIVFISGLIFEIIRFHCIHQPLMKFINNKCTVILNKADKFYNQ